MNDLAHTYKYCFSCGGDLQFTKDNLLTCKNCDYKWYINACPCNGALILNSKKELLLVKRKIDPFKDLWDIPGGFVNLNENLEESLSRELKEELGIDVKPQTFKYFGSFNDRYLYYGINNYTLGMIFSVEINQKQLDLIHAGDDAKELKFFGLNAIPWERIAFPSVKEILKIFVNQQN
jgi:ADP-ribose pyrophosphatase YjhB (NUDIX family)